MTSPCPSCSSAKGPGKYLCPSCWSALTGPAQRALSRHDDRALTRLRELHNQIGQGVPLPDVSISA